MWIIIDIVTGKKTIVAMPGIDRAYTTPAIKPRTSG